MPGGAPGTTPGSGVCGVRVRGRRGVTCAKFTSWGNLGRTCSTRLTAWFSGAVGPGRATRPRLRSCGLGCGPAACSGPWRWRGAGREPAVLAGRRSKQGCCPLAHKAEKPSPLLPPIAPPGLGLALVDRLVVTSVQPATDACGPQRCRLPACPLGTSSEPWGVDQCNCHTRLLRAHPPGSLFSYTLLRGCRRLLKSRKKRCVGWRGLLVCLVVLCRGGDRGLC